jgi:subtilisin family serine protease
MNNIFFVDLRPLINFLMKNKLLSGFLAEVMGYSKTKPKANFINMSMLVLMAFVSAFSTELSAQSTVPSPMSIRQNQIEWAENQLLIRFSDNINISFDGNNSNFPQVDSLTERFNLISAKQLFPLQKNIPNGATSFVTYTGQTVEYPKLTNIYELTFDTTFQFMEIFTVVEAFQTLQDIVKYAEPNYKFKLSTTPSDSLYPFQYNASSMNVDSVWEIMNDSSVTDNQVVIGILDTGVDTTHADLAGRLYINQFEIPNNGIDDDNNGFIDDVAGWDFVNNDNYAGDDNSHGTHCAGIAVANHNSFGIAGISKGAKYMPIKILQSSGSSSASVIAQGVVYAGNNGADILSMSFGGYGRSLALENALAYAYAFSLPVGAAGNDGLCIRNDGFPCPDGRFPAPMYPGAYTFVLAAQSTQQSASFNGFRSWFSNYDFDGPTYTDYADEFNYEVYAPGSNILSTIPGGSYTTYSGTSMACPAVAGGVAMYMAFRPNNSKEKLFIDFITSWYDLQGTFTKNQGGAFPSLDLVKAIWPQELPLIWAKSIAVIDSALGDGDGKLDAGERVMLRADVKNLGSSADSIFLGLRVSRFEDPTVINLIDSLSFIGSLSPYASGSNNTNMFEFTVNTNVVNGRNISLNVYSWKAGGSDTTSQDFVLRAQAGCEYNGIYGGKTVWDVGCGIIVTGNSFFDTLIVNPGTFVQLDANVGIAYNHIVCQGKPDSMITFTKNQNDWQLWSGITSFRDTALFKYTIFEYGWPRTSSQLVGPGNKITFEDCIFRYNEHYYGNTYTGNHITLAGNTSVKRCVFTYNMAQSHIIGLEDDNWTGTFEDNIFAGNLTQNGIQPLAGVSIRTPNDLSRIKGNSFLRHRQMLWAVPNHNPNGFPIGVRWSNGGGANLPTFQINYLDSNYYGFSNSQAIESSIYDFTDNPVFAVVNGSLKALPRGSSKAHGHVTRVKINNQDVNIFDNPIHQIIGPGNHQIKVQFNRKMDVSKTPFVAYGVRSPFTQNILNDSAYWSPDSTSWTSFLRISQTTTSDGYNKVSIRNAIDDEGFEMPIEDYRFEFRINVAGALSRNFNALGDSAKITLSWSRPDAIVDLIGYNIYRIDTTVDANGDGVFNDTVLINSSLILDTFYVDQQVQGGKFYRYHFTSLRSNLTESQLSSGVWAEAISAPPAVVTKKAIQTSLNSLTFDSEIDANFIETQARFIFGMSANTLTNSTSWQSIGNNHSFLSYQQIIQLTGTGQKIYYQAQAQNALGIRVGQLDSILTLSTPTVTITTPSNPCVGSFIYPTINTLSPDPTLQLTFQVNNGPILNTLDSLQILDSLPITITVRANGDYSIPAIYNHIIYPSVLQAGANVLLLSGPTVFCSGGNVTISVPNGVNSILWNTGDTSNSISVSASGTYFATFRTNIGQCLITSTPVVVTVNELSNANIISPTSSFSFCQGSALMLRVAPGAANYQWQYNGSPVSGAIADTFNAIQPGTYAVLVTNLNGCQVLSTPVQVTIQAAPSTQINNLTPGVACEGDTVRLQAPSGLSYLWSTGDTTQTISVYQTSSITLTTRNANGCSATSAAMAISFNPIPALTITPSRSTSLCVNESVVLSASGGFASYLWSNGSTSQTLIVNTPGNYSVSGITAGGCVKNSNIIQVSVDTTAGVTITPSGSTSFCIEDSVILTASGGFTNYVWNNNEVGNTIVVRQPGTYSVRALNTNGCLSVSNNITVNLLQSPPVPFVYLGPDARTLISSFPTNNQWYLQNIAIPGANQSSFVPATNGIYSVKVTLTNGCSSESGPFNYFALNTTQTNADLVTVYPNPSSGLFTIQFPENLIGSEIQIFNQIGQLVFKTLAESSQNHINLADYAKGIYQVRIINEKEIVIKTMLLQ